MSSEKDYPFVKRIHMLLDNRKLDNSFPGYTLQEAPTSGPRSASDAVENIRDLHNEYRSPGSVKDAQGSDKEFCHKPMNNKTGAMEPFSLGRNRMPNIEDAREIKHLSPSSSITKNAKIASQFPGTNSRHGGEYAGSLGTSPPSQRHVHIWDHLASPIQRRPPHPPPKTLEPPLTDPPTDFTSLLSEISGLRADLTKSLSEISESMQPLVTICEILKAYVSKDQIEKDVIVAEVRKKVDAIKMLNKGTADEINRRLAVVENAIGAQQQPMPVGQGDLKYYDSEGGWGVSMPRGNEGAGMKLGEFSGYGVSPSVNNVRYNLAAPARHAHHFL